MAIEGEQELRNGTGREPEAAGGISQLAGDFDPKQAMEMVGGIAKEHPHAALAGAMAVGFLLGGGLTPKIVGALGFILARKYFRDTVAQTIDGVLRDQVFGQQPPNSTRS